MFSVGRASWRASLRLRAAGGMFSSVLVLCSAPVPTLAAPVDVSGYFHALGSRAQRQAPEAHAGGVQGGLGGRPPQPPEAPPAPLIASVDGRARCLSCGGTSRSPVPLRRSRRGRCCVRARREAAQPPSRRGSAPAGCATRRPLLASRRASRRLSELLAASTAAAATTTTARSFAAAAARWLAALLSLATWLAAL